MSEAVLTRSGQGITWPKTAMGKAVAVIVFAWFVMSVSGIISGFFYYSSGQPPVNILLAITVPVVLFGIAYNTIGEFKEWVLSLDLRHLVLIHSLRMIGMGFVFLYFQDRLPALFAFPAGIGDAMAAVGALLLGITMYENSRAVSNKTIWRWNTFGLMDFVVAISMGVMTRTEAVLYIESQAGSDIMSTFPLGLIPGFFVPFYIITHLVVYMQLRRRK